MLVANIGLFCIMLQANKLNSLFIFVGTGTSSDQCYPNYHGLKPFSAPETRYLRDAIIALTQTGTGVAAFISFHSYSKFLLVPYAYTSVRPSDADELVCLWTNSISNITDNSF